MRNWGRLMRRIAIINQKGGGGKTTTSVNLAAALARAGKRVLLLDLDPQAHATTHLGKEPNGKSPSLYDVLTENRPIADVRVQAGENLWLAGSDINLAAAEVELAGVVGREVILRDLLQPELAAFDYVLMDCGPSLGVLIAVVAGADLRDAHSPQHQAGGVPELRGVDFYLCSQLPGGAGLFGTGERSHGRRPDRAFWPGSIGRSGQRRSGDDGDIGRSVGQPFQADANPRVAMSPTENTSGWKA